MLRENVFESNQTIDCSLRTLNSSFLQFSDNNRTSQFCKNLTIWQKKRLKVVENLKLRFFSKTAMKANKQLAKQKLIYRLNSGLNLLRISFIFTEMSTKMAKLNSPLIF